MTIICDSITTVKFGGFMKKYLLFVLALFVSCFLGCDQPNQSKDDDEPKIEIPFAGTYYKFYDKDENNSYYSLQKFNFNTTEVIFSIQMYEDEYSFDPKEDFVNYNVHYKISSYDTTTHEMTLKPFDISVEKNGTTLSRAETLDYLILDSGKQYTSIEEYVKEMDDMSYSIVLADSGITVDGELFTNLNNYTAEKLYGTWKSFYEREATESWPFNLVELTFQLNAESQITMQSDFYFVSGTEKTLLNSSIETAKLLYMNPVHLICTDYEEKEIDYTTTPPTEESRTESSSFIDYVFNGDTLEVSDFIFTKS